MKVLLENHEDTIIVKSEEDIPWGYIKQAETQHIIFFTRGAQIYAMGKNDTELEHAEN